LGVNAQGGQACLAQARQDRPGNGELDLTELVFKDLTGFLENLIDNRFIRANTIKNLRE